MFKKILFITGLSLCTVFSNENIAKPDSLKKDTAIVKPVTLAADSIVPYESPDILHGAFFDREGPSVIFTQHHLDAMHAVNLCDVLDYLPGLFAARSSFMGTLSDIRQQGKETYLDDKPINIEVDGVEMRGINASRVYLNNIPVKDIEKVIVDERGGGFSGSEIIIRVFTKQEHISDPVSDVFWEQGPFEANAVKFSLKRRLGKSVGFFIGMEKTYQSEGQGFYSTGPIQYTHPAAIVDIYRAVLNRPDNLYVAQGNRFENYSRLWTIKLNTTAIPCVELNSEYIFLRDKQDDYRDNPRYGVNGTGVYQNFSTQNELDDFKVSGRATCFKQIDMNGTVYTYGSRLGWPAKGPSVVSGDKDTSVFLQGLNVLGARFNSSYNRPGQKYSLLLESAQDGVNAVHVDRTIRRDLIETSIELGLDSILKIPMELSAKNDFRRDSRTSGNSSINTNFSASPWVGLYSMLFRNHLRLDVDYGCERRYPNSSILYYDNPKINYIGSDSAVKRIVSSSTGAGIEFNESHFGFGYKFRERFTRNPATLQFVLHPSGILQSGWRFTQNVVRFERLQGHELFGEWHSEHISEYAGLHITHVNYARSDTRQVLPFYTFNVVNNLSFFRYFMKNRLFGRISFYTSLRPDVWAVEYYLPESGLDVLNRFIDFNMDIEFKIKAFSFFTRFENLGNQVISYEPGYHLPGPVIRWGIDWNFGG